MSKLYHSLGLGLFLLSSLHTQASFREYPAGDPVEMNGLKIAAVYFPAVAMDHRTMQGVPDGKKEKSASTTGHSHHASHSMEVLETDLQKEKFVPRGKELIHLEADISALNNNPSGFAAGEWIPYLQISFALFEKGKKEAIMEGALMPMIAKDGPHYGTTIRMPGKGSYRLEYQISAPQIARHSDPKTGVAEYWKPFKTSFDFEYEGFAKDKLSTQN